MTLGLHRNYIYKDVSQKENFSFCDTFCSKTLSLYSIKDLLLEYWFLVLQYQQNETISNKEKKVFNSTAERMNHEGVCRRALATLGLLNRLY